MSDFKVKMHRIRFPLWLRPERGKKREEEGGSEGRAAPKYSGLEPPLYFT